MSSSSTAMKLTLKISSFILRGLLNIIFVILVVIVVIYGSRTAYNFTYRLYGPVSMDKEPGRDANFGECTHSCRWRYHIVEEKRQGEFLPIEENERGTYIFNSKDLCMIEYIPELVNAGINSLKVEGRMKTALYVATVAGAYRRAIDDYFDDPKIYERNKPIYLKEVLKGVNRQFTTGFFFGKPNHNDQIYDNNTYEKSYTYLGTIIGERDGLYNLEQKNKFSLGEEIEVIRPGSGELELVVKRIIDEKGNDMDSCPHPKQSIYIDLGVKLNPYDILRRKEID